MFVQKVKTVFAFTNTRSKVVLILAYWIITVLIYFPAHKGLLIDDGLAGLVKFERAGFAGLWKSFGFPSLYYFHDFFDLLVYTITGKNALLWFLVMATFHSLNSALAFFFFRKLYSILNVQHPSVIALAGSLLFLLSPYQTENVVWAATLHYSITLLIFLLSNLLIVHDLANDKLTVRTIAIIVLLFAVATTTLEIALVFPFAYFTVACIIIFNRKSKVTFSDLVLKLLLPLLLVVVIYFIATRLIKGHWLPHYGITHLQNNNIKTYSITGVRYLVKLLGFAHFYNYPARDSVYSYCDHWHIMLLVFTCAVVGVIALLVFLKKTLEARVFAGLTVLSFILLAPALNLYFAYLFTTENDRLSYFFSLVLYQIVPFVLVSILFYEGIGVATLYGIAGLWFLCIQVKKWQQGAEINERCITSFKWLDAQKVFVLNCPTNYKGVYEFRNIERLPWALQFYKGRNMDQQIVTVLSSCCTSPHDSTAVTIKNDSTLYIQAITDGGWLMNEFVGASDCSTDSYSVTLDKSKPAYSVVFHKKLPNAVYIYSTPSGFKELEGF